MSHLHRRARTAVALAALAGVATPATGLALVLPAAADPGQQTDRYVVSFRDGRTVPGREAVRGVGGRVVLGLGQQSAAAVVVPRAQVATLRADRDVLSVEKDPVRVPVAASPAAAPKPDPGPAPTAQDVTDPDGETTPYGVSLTRADRLPGLATAGSPKKVCVMDTGYYPGHEDLPPAGVTGTDYDGTGPWDSDEDGHGTHVAGTVVAPANGVGVVGVAPGVGLHVVRVFAADGTFYASDLVRALDDCVAAGSDVVNMSLGGPQKVKVEKEAFAAAYASGVLPVAAAGNGGDNKAEYPAGYDSVVSVGAVDGTSQHAAFSQTTPDVELAAPGVGVLSTVPYVATATLTVDGQTFQGGVMVGAGQTTAAGVAGPLVDGGVCTSADPGWAGAVVLCRRDGVQTFESKTEAVQSAGGVATVIANNAPGPLSAGFDGTTRIPAIGITQTDGETAAGYAGEVATVVHLRKRASGYDYYDGTSMATPHVSGIAAAVWSLSPGASVAQVRAALDASALDLGKRGRDKEYGYGIVQADAALALLGGAGS